MKDFAKKVLKMFGQSVKCMYLCRCKTYEKRTAKLQQFRNMENKNEQKLKNLEQEDWESVRKHRRDAIMEMVTVLAMIGMVIFLCIKM